MMEDGDLSESVLDSFDMCDDAFAEKGARTVNTDDTFVEKRPRMSSIGSESSASTNDTFGEKRARTSSMGSESGRTNSALYDSFDYTLKIAEEMEDVRLYHYLRISQTVDHQRGQSTVDITEV